jgi:hypothetical protein
MADKQGAANVYSKNSIILVRSLTIVEGWVDGAGVRRGMKMEDDTASLPPHHFNGEHADLGSLLRTALIVGRLSVSSAKFENRPDPIAPLLHAFGTRDTSDLFHGLISVLVNWTGDTLRLSPTRADGKGGFSGIHEKEGVGPIELPFEASDLDVGLALVEAIGRSR